MFTKTKGGEVKLAAGNAITLFPVTPYLVEWYNLREDKEGTTYVSHNPLVYKRKVKTNVYLSEEAFKYKYVAQADVDGRFKFTRMKPGKYFLQTFISWEYQTTYVTTYTQTNGFGQTTGWNQYNMYNNTANYRAEKVVEIKSNGEVVEVILN